MSNTGAAVDIEIILNGEKRVVPAGLTLQSLLEILRIEADRVAIELNREIVRRTHWPSRVIEHGAELEIVQFVGGG